jgi:hypothetical protein
MGLLCSRISSLSSSVSALRPDSSHKAVLWLLAGGFRSIDCGRREFGILTAGEGSSNRSGVNGVLEKKSKSCDCRCPKRSARAVPR